jgi:hypothetical protein
MARSSTKQKSSRSTSVTWSWVTSCQWQEHYKVMLVRRFPTYPHPSHPSHPNSMAQSLKLEARHAILKETTPSWANRTSCKHHNAASWKRGSEIFKARKNSPQQYMVLAVYSRGPELPFLRPDCNWAERGGVCFSLISYKFPLTIPQWRAHH